MFSHPGGRETSAESRKRAISHLPPLYNHDSYTKSHPLLCTHIQIVICVQSARWYPAIYNQPGRYPHPQSAGRYTRRFSLHARPSARSRDEKDFTPCGNCGIFFNDGRYSTKKLYQLTDLEEETHGACVFLGIVYTGTFGFLSPSAVSDRSVHRPPERTDVFLFHKRRKIS